MQKYAKLCKTMQNYAKTFLKFKKFEISLENNPQMTTIFFRWSDFVHNNPFLISLSYLHNFRKHYLYIVAEYFRWFIWPTCLPKRKIPPSAPLLIPPVRVRVRWHLHCQGSFGGGPGAELRLEVLGGKVPGNFCPKKAYIWRVLRQSVSE